MRIRVFSMLLLILVLSFSAVSARADILGSAASYAVLAKTIVTDASGGLSTQTTLINGISAASPTMGAVSCTGFVAGTGCTAGAGVVVGTTNLNNGAYTGAIADSLTAYNALFNTTPTITELGNTCLGVVGGTCTSAVNNLAPGVYDFNDSVTLLNGALVLNGGGNANALWIFQIDTALTTGVSSSVSVIGTGAGAGVYWQVGSQATLGVNSTMQGNILAGTNISFQVGAQDICGRAFTNTAAGTSVTFDGFGTQKNLVNLDSCQANGFNGGVITTGGGVGPGTGIPVPEPGTLALLPFGLLGIIALRFRKARVSSVTC